ncbi:MAG: hypothetical protein WC325_11275 [Candidatus Bathyarchaeia archaeon]
MNTKRGQIPTETHAVSICRGVLVKSSSRVLNAKKITESYRKSPIYFSQTATTHVSAGTGCTTKTKPKTKQPRIVKNQNTLNMHPHPQPEKLNIPQHALVKKNSTAHNITDQKTQPNNQTEPKTKPEK